MVLQASPPKTKCTLQEKAAYVAGTDKMQVVVTLDAKDLQQLQLKRTTLFADRATTFVLIAGGGVEDTTGLKLASMKAALQTETFGNRDIVGLRSFDLNMSSAQLTLQFKGAVDAKSFEPDQLTLRSATATGAGTQTVALTASSTTSSANAMKIVVDIGDSDMDRIKAMRKLATRKNNTYVEMTAKVFVDLFGTRISSLVPNDGVVVNDFTADTVAPVLKAFDLNVDPGTIRLNFPETVDLNTFTAKGLALTTLGNSINLTLSGGTIVEKAIEKKDSSTVFTIAMDKADLDELKHNLKLGTTTVDTYALVLSSLVSDMNSNPVTHRMDLQAAEVAKDETDPEFKSFDMDMSKGEITLTFSEAIFYSQTLMALKDFTGSYGRKLSGGTPTQVSETVVKLKLSLSDLNAIKAIRQVAVSKATTFLHVDHGAFTDGNKNKVVKAYKIVSTFDDDKVSPTLDAFDLSMDSRQLALRFSETVDGSTYTHSGITLHSNDGTAGKAVSLTLGAGSKIVQAIDSATLVIQLDKGDTDAIKNIPGFCNSKATVFVSITDKFMKDTNKRLIDAIPRTKALPATKYTFDETDAAVTTFSFNLHTKTLTMNFDEPVDATNVNVTSLVFQSQKRTPPTANASSRVPKTRRGAKMASVL